MNSTRGASTDVYKRQLNDSGNMIKDKVNLGLSATGAGMFNVSAKAEANASLNKEKGRWNAEASLTPVSYTHLDVYKRQEFCEAAGPLH